MTHIPFRSWCPHCVQGRGLGEKRGRRVGRQHEIPRVGIEYWYMTSKGLMKRDGLQGREGTLTDNQVEEGRVGGDIVKCLIVKCHDSKCVFAHAIPRKGGDEDHYVAGKITSDVAWMGHVRLLLKSDNDHLAANSHRSGYATWFAFP